MDFEPLKQFMDYLTNWRIPGNDISVWKDNKEVFRYQSGYLDLEKKIQMQPDHLIYIYSCSKLALAVAGMQLIEKKELLLDTPLYDYIPEFKDVMVKTSDGNIKKAVYPITIRHLFTMTSGMSYTMPDEIKEEASKITNSLFNTIETVKCMAQIPLIFEPGQGWNYSFSHDVLAAVIEIVSGKKYRDYIKDNIFEPLDMNDSFFHLTDIQMNRLAPQYRFVDETAENDLVKNQIKNTSDISGRIELTDSLNTLVFGVEYDSGGAGIITTVSDYAKFANALACKGVGKTGERILEPKTIDFLRTNQLNEIQLKNFNWTQLMGYGYGFGVRTMLNPKACNSLGNVGEFGWGGAAGASVYVDPSIGLGVFYAHHMLNPQEDYYQPRLRDTIYRCIYY